MVVTGRDAAELAIAWGLGAGVSVEPAAEAGGVREAYAIARGLVVDG